MEIFFLIGCPLIGMFLSFIWLRGDTQKVRPNYNRRDLK